MILGRYHIRQLRAGKHITVTRPGARIGAEYPVKLETGGRTLFKVTVTAINGNEATIVPYIRRTEPHRLLAANPSSHELDPVPHPEVDRGYTANPLSAVRGEQEAVPDSCLKRFALENRQADVARHAERRERWELQTHADRLRELVERAEHAGLDVTRHLNSIDGRLRALERAIDKHTAGRRAA